jgi:hypothetical protein
MITDAPVKELSLFSIVVSITSLIEWQQPLKFDYQYASSVAECPTAVDELVKSSPSIAISANLLLFLDAGE